MFDKITIYQKTEDQNEISKYESALNLLFYEGQIAWQMNILFIGLNVGIGTVIGEKLCNIDSNKCLFLFFSIAGVIINYYWWGTFRRNNKYYHFRMAQAREAEPLNWRLLKDRGYKFSKGEPIKIYGKGIWDEDRSHQLNKFEKKASNKKVIEVSIWIFIIGYLLLFISVSYAVFMFFSKCI